MPVEYVRGAMAGRINVHAHGNSGCRLEITQTLVEMLNKGVTPVVCEKGSVAACGDLAPMSQIALLMMGEGEAFFNGERLPGKEALDKAKEIIIAFTDNKIFALVSAILLKVMWLRMVTLNMVSIPRSGKTSLFFFKVNASFF